jgi:hypothetical protein
MPLKGMGKAAVGFVRQLEDVGKNVSKYGRATRLSGIRSGSRPGMMAGSTMKSAGGAIGAMGRHPKTTMAVGGLAGIGLASQMRTRTALSGGSVADMTRQDTMYNNRMRRGQSSALDGLQPKSMGGYA